MISYFLFTQPSNDTLQNHRVESPASVCTSYFLTHRRQEALRIKKSGNPKDFRFALEPTNITSVIRCRTLKKTKWVLYQEYPLCKLSVAFQKFGEPETQGRTLPRNSFPRFRHSCIVHCIHCLKKMWWHDNRSLNSQFQVQQHSPNLEKTKRRISFI